MSDSGAIFVAAFACAFACACATTKSETPIGVDHSAYAAKPAYLGKPALPRAHFQTRRGGNAPLHADAPAVAEAPADESAAPEAEEVTAQPEGAERGGTWTVAPVDSPPPVNRQSDTPNAWQPTISAPEQTPNNPNQ